MYGLPPSGHRGFGEPGRAANHVVFGCVPVPLFCLLHALVLLAVGFCWSYGYEWAKRIDESIVGYQSYNEYTWWHSGCIVGYGGVLFGICSAYCTLTYNWDLHIWPYLYLNLRFISFVTQLILDIPVLMQLCGPDWLVGGELHRLGDPLVICFKFSEMRYFLVQMEKI